MGSPFWYHHSTGTFKRYVWSWSGIGYFLYDGRTGLGCTCSGMSGYGYCYYRTEGWPLQNSIIVGAIIGILWVVFAGMKELGAVNVVNATVMYIGLIIATVAVAFKMPGGNFNFIMDTFTGEESFMTNVFGNANLFISFAVGQIIAVTFCQGISQMLMQVFFVRQ